MAETEKKEKSFWDFRDTIFEGGILDVVGTKEKIKAEEARRKVMEDRTGWSFKDLVKFGLSKGAPKNEHLRAANIGMTELMRGSGPPPQPGATDRFGEPIESKEILEFRKGITDRDEMLAQREELKKQIDDAKLKAEEEAAFLDSPKGRLQTLWADADKREAVLGGIADAMLETRTGVDAYGSRLHRAQKNVRENLKIAEATDIARNKAQVDAMKVLAETNKLLDPRQYLSNAQKEADSYVQAQIRAGKILPRNYDSAYATMLKQIAVKDLTSAKSSSIKDLYTYAIALESTDPVTANILKDAIRSNAMYLAGDGTEFGAQTDTANEIIVKDTVTTTN